jgi:hypothetical protein
MRRRREVLGQELLRVKIRGELGKRVWSRLDLRPGAQGLLSSKGNDKIFLSGSFV